VEVVEGALLVAVEPAGKQDGEDVEEGGMGRGSVAALQKHVGVVVAAEPAVSRPPDSAMNPPRRSAFQGG
jgi:hypothetical protein